MAAVDDVLPVILGAGGAGMVAALAQALSSWRNGVEQREARAVGNLERWRVEADARAERLQRLLEAEQERSRYWLSYVGRLERAIEHAGLTLPGRPVHPDETGGSGVSGDPAA